MPSGSVRDRTNSKWRTWQALVRTRDIKSKYQGRKCDFCSTFERQGLVPAFRKADVHDPESQVERDAYIFREKWN